MHVLCAVCCVRRLHPNGARFLFPLSSYTQLLQSPLTTITARWVPSSSLREKLLWPNRHTKCCECMCARCLLPAAAEKTKTQKLRSARKKKHAQLRSTNGNVTRSIFRFDQRKFVVRRSPLVAHTHTHTAFLLIFFGGAFLWRPAHAHPPNIEFILLSPIRGTTDTMFLALCVSCIMDRIHANILYPFPRQVAVYLAFPCRTQ